MVILASVNENIEPIQVTSEKMVNTYIDNMNQITFNNVDEAEKLVPFYRSMIEEKELELGISFKMWNPNILFEVDEMFKERYLNKWKTL